MNKKDLTNKVTLLLLENNNARDCDITLYIGIAKIYGVLYGTAIQLLWDMKDGRMPSFETISRIRRKVQEDNESLRGEKWATRHNEKQIKAKKDLGYAIK